VYQGGEGVRKSQRERRVGAKGRREGQGLKSGREGGRERGEGGGSVCEKNKANEQAREFVRIHIHPYIPVAYIYIAYIYIARQKYRHVYAHFSTYTHRGTCYESER